MSKISNIKNTLAELREKAEKTLDLRQKKGKPNKLHMLTHELDVHEIELIMQNEQLIDTQTQLKTALSEYEELFEFSPLGYFILDENGIIKNVNATGITQFGFIKSKLLKKPFSIFIKGEEKQDDFYRYRNHIMENHDIQELECEIVRQDSSTFTGLLKSTVVKNNQNEFKHFLLMVSDISEIKQSKHAIEMALVKSEELNELKSRFITLASHEFRTPLTLVLSSVTLAEKHLELSDTENLKKHLNRIKSAAEHITMMLNQFLSLEKLESGAVSVEKVNLNVPEFCKSIIEEISDLTKKNQTIIYHHKGKKQISTDINIFKSILIYVLSNACKFSAEHESVDFVTEINNDKLMIMVKDYGIGIPEKEQKNLFSKFYRAQNALNIKGSGLELYIIKKYLALIGGEISFTSRLNEGSTFCIQFPVEN